jgi:hypothetical protein
MRSHLLRHKIDYVLLTPMNGFREREAVWSLIGKLSARHPGALQTVWELPRQPFRILRVDRARLASGARPEDRPLP